MTSRSEIRTPVCLGYKTWIHLNAVRTCSFQLVSGLTDRCLCDFNVQHIYRFWLSSDCGPVGFSLMYWKTSGQADCPSATEIVRGSNPKSVGHFGGRRQLAVLRLVATLDLMKPCVLIFDSKFQGSDCRSLPHGVVSRSGYGTFPFHCTGVSCMS